VAAIGVAKLAESVADIGEEFDKLTRKQQAVLNISPAQQAPLIKQAIGLGGTTPFNDIQVLQAQTALITRGVPFSAAVPITDVAATYAQAQGIDLPTAAKLMESAYFASSASGATKKSPEEIKKDISRLVDVMVKTSQVSGLEADELAQFVKFGLPTAHAAGVGLPFFMSVGATMKRGGIPGEEAGVASRFFISSLLKPTSQALTALDALGIHYKDYATAGKAMRAEDLSAAIQRIMGKKLSPSGLGQVQALLSNPAIAGDQAKLTSGLMKILGPGLKPKDSREVAKVIENFWKHRCKM
jgi:TP901 family phage tail tape measure protein